MDQAGLLFEASGSFNTTNNIWTRIISDVICITSLVLQRHANQQIIDRVTVVRGYADLSVMYPNIAAYRQRVSASLLSLSETLRAYGDVTFGAQLNSINDRCRKFDGFTFKTDNGRDVRRYHAEHYRVPQGNNA